MSFLVFIAGKASSRKPIKPWLPQDHGFYVNQASVANLGVMHVADLQLPDQNCWDVDRVRSLCSFDDAKSILSIPVTSNNVADKLIWHFDSKGVYSVKSGYHIAVNRLENAPIDPPDVPWHHVWKIQAAPKVREFMWRALRDILPTKSRLLSRGIPMSPVSPSCPSAETVTHTLLHCARASTVWQLWNRDLAVIQLSFVDCFLTILGHGSTEMLAEFSILCWKIWNARNKLVWSSSDIPGSTLFSQALSYLHDWQQATVRPSRPLHMSLDHNDPVLDNNIRWKCFVDAAIFQEFQQVGAAAVLCTPAGDFVHAFSSHSAGTFQPRCAEALAIRDTLRWLLPFARDRGVILTDARLVVTAAQSETDDFTEFGSIIAECKDLLASRPDIHVQWIRRAHNDVAHSVARLSSSFDSFHLWESIPPCIDIFF